MEKAYESKHGLMEELWGDFVTLGDTLGGRGNAFEVLGGLLETRWRHLWTQQGLFRSRLATLCNLRENI